MRIVWLSALLFIALPVRGAAQETRAGVIAAEQSNKAANLTQYEPHWAERLLTRATASLRQQPEGFYPYVGSVYSGGGFTLGAGYRRYTGDRAHWNVGGMYSVKGYKLLEVGMNSPGHLAGRVDLRAGAAWRDATQVGFHGLGIDSPADIDTAFRLQQFTTGAALSARPHRWWVVTAGASFEDFTTTDPTGDLTSVEDVFTAATAPGVGADVQYVHTTGAIAFDWRPAEGYARRGGAYRLGHHHYGDSDGGTYSFQRIEAEVVQHIPVLRENWVVSLRGRLEATPDAEDVVPFFMLPSLGSGSSLRGYSSWRFRDRHAALLSGEWRWIVNRMAMDMAIFYDTGMVAPRLSELALDRFVSNVGVGVRFHSPVQTPLRVEIAHGSEGLHVVFAASAAF